jgi:hypothetical protein
LDYYETIMCTCSTKEFERMVKPFSHTKYLQTLTQFKCDTTYQAFAFKILQCVSFAAVVEQVFFKYDQFFNLTLKDADKACISSIFIKTYQFFFGGSLTQET